MKQQTYVTDSGVRRLTPLEWERLQGFPDGWTDGQSDSKRYRQLGNAVAVPVAEWLGRRIVGVQRSH
jgi:DNA (cytosine-5)-methyltransferase 1